MLEESKSESILPTLNTSIKIVKQKSHSLQEQTYITMIDRLEALKFDPYF